jgi:hypothetical protein
LLRLIKQLILLLVMSTPQWAAAADLPIVSVEESSLPYGLSPNNYDNSPSNYNNSISNYDNSPSNYDNSESNYDNSATNLDNGRSGDRRLIYMDGSTPRFAGYFVRASNGVTNFFSPSGLRIFYNPKKGRGIYGGKDGSFCGVFARVDGKFSLALTENGLKLFFLTR